MLDIIVIPAKRFYYLHLEGNKYRLQQMKTKYTYVKVIQQYFGTWEDVSEYETNSLGTPKEWSDKPHIAPNGNKRKQSLLLHDLKEYKLMGYPVRVIRRKELNN